MQLEDVKYDCRYFRGHIPCQPNKDHQAICPNCEHYSPVDKKILIIKLGAMGDVIRTTPLAVRFRKEYPNCHITWLTLSPAILPSQGIDTICKYNATSLFILQNRKFDIALNLDKEPEACLLLAKVEAKEKYGFTWENGHVAPATPKAKHKILTGFFDQLSQANTKSYLEEIFEICHFDFQGEKYLMDVPPQYDQKWKELLREKARGKKVVGLNTGCGARWKTRLWPAKNWIALIRLLENAGYFPMVLGGPDEHEQNLIYQRETGVYYPGTYSLKEFIAISNNCDVIVSAVSMMMHIATALQRPLVLFNNIFNKHEYELYNNGEIVEPETGCECFYGTSCKRERHCMEDLPVQAVLNAVERWAKT